MRSNYLHDYEYYVALAWDEAYSYPKYKELKLLWLTDHEMITRKREILLTPKKHDIMYSDYLEICSVLEYTPFSESTFYKNFSESDFWSRHPKIVVSDIELKWEDCLNLLDKRYIRNLWNLWFIKLRR